ncbi:MAG TPA: LytTR family DNA-binding domain-containing protein [Gemmatimonadales bacterium]|nr:LytTR family DNA-binding domain-containing protein [Gemmatimonadales bacterium]
MYFDGDSPARRVPGAGWPRRPTDAPPTQGRPLRSVIVDADRLARRHLQQLLQEEPGIDLVAECDAGQPAVEVIALARPDLVFLEIVLPDTDGFALGTRLRPHVPGGLVYVSDRPQGALQAFDVHALAYLLKPVGRERLRGAVAHARALLLPDRRGAEDRLVALLDQRDAERQRRARLLIRHADGAFFLRTESIDWIEAADKLVRIHAGKHVYEQREALARIERHLDPDQFVRVSRSAIVNIDRIREIQPWFNGEHLVLLDDDCQVPTSRHYRTNVRRLFGRGDGP